VNDHHLPCARRVEHPAARRDHRLQRRDVVAERFAESARDTKAFQKMLRRKL
jgi:hypothetical protein